MKANSQWIAHHTRSFQGLIRMNSHSHLFRNNNRASFFTWNKESASVSKQEKKEQQNKMLQKEIDVANKLKLITEPITNRRLSSIGCVQQIKVEENDQIRINLDVLVPGYQHKQKIKEEVEQKIKELQWVKGIEIEFIDKPYPVNEASVLSKIHHIIGVSSCKGGVGKSTVAVNLACTLALKGLRVGILDADVYGPSLPIQLKPVDSSVKRSPTNPAKFILPLVSKDIENLKMISFGHVNPNSGAPGSGGKSAALMRGPLASKVINQLLLATDWGELDYLIVDMPPGTGDIQLTLSQTAQFTGAVIVTTPHVLSLVDAAKGVELFRTVNIPTLALVENMSYFRCDAGKIYHPFGKGGREQLIRSLTEQKTVTNVQEITQDIENSSYFSLPLCTEGAGMKRIEENSNNIHNDSKGMELLSSPLVISYPQSESAGVYHQLADAVIEQIFRLQIDTQFVPSIYLDKAGNGLRLRYFTATQAMEYFLSSAQLRRRDPKTGQLLAGSIESSSASPVIQSIDMKGSYGVGVNWSDRHDIFPYDVLKEIADEEQQQKQSN